MIFKPVIAIFSVLVIYMVMLILCFTYFHDDLEKYLKGHRKLLSQLLTLDKACNI